MAVTAEAQAGTTLRATTSLKPAAVLAICCLAGLLSATPAEAARSRLSWTLPTTATANSPTAFSWTATNLQPGSQLVVQRQEGSARVWRTMVQLPNRPSGSVQLPGLLLGSYRLRIVDFGSHARALAQQQRQLSVFGQVPFSTLFGGGGSGDVYATPTSTFRTSSISTTAASTTRPSPSTITPVGLSTWNSCRVFKQTVPVNRKARRAPQASCKRAWIP
jgi:hypothetical protein